MTLRLQFDDVIRKFKEARLMDDTEEMFEECILNGMRVRDNLNALKKEIEELKKCMNKKKKVIRKIKSKVESEKKKYDEEKKKTQILQKERDTMESLLAETRNLIMGHDSTDPELLSILDSTSIKSLSP